MKLFPLSSKAVACIKFSNNINIRIAKLTKNAVNDKILRIVVSEITANVENFIRKNYYTNLK